jgi:hypothetical protein
MNVNGRVEAEMAVIYALVKLEAIERGWMSG